MRADLVTGNEFPDLRLPDHIGRERSLSELAEGRPLVLCFVRGWWCPKDQVRVRMLVAMQEEIQRETARIVAVTVDEPYVNGAFRAGIGADFPFLSDEDRRVAEDLDLVEETDAKHRPYLPTTFVLDSRRRIQRGWTGFWFAGNPTPDELRQALREVVRAEQPTFDPQRVWRVGGAESTGGPADGAAIWIREDAQGREIQRGVHEGDLPREGEEVSRSEVDGRPWVVHAVERAGGGVAIHLRKGGEADTERTVRHSITVPRSV